MYWPSLFLASARQAVREIPSPTPSSEQELQLLVDVSIIAKHDAGTGIQRVVRALLLNLLQAPPPGLTVRPVYATRKQPYKYANDYLFRLTGSADRGDDGIVEVHAGDVFLGLDLASRILPKRQRELLQWRASGVRLTFIVYDLLPAVRPHWFTPRASKSFRQWLCVLAVHSDALFCISASVAAQATEWFQRNHEVPPAALQIDWFHLGADLAASGTEARGTRIRDQTKIEMDRGLSVLMVGTIEPRKGHADVLSAFDIIWRSGVDVRLLIVGDVGWHVDGLAARLRQHPQAGRHLLWLKHVSDEELARLYQSADGLLMASEAEGFGLPLVEAAQYGMPVLARDLDVFREVGGHHISYFTATTGEQLSVPLSNWLEALRNGTSPDSSRMPWLTWAESASQLKALFDTCDRRQRASGEPPT